MVLRFKITGKVFRRRLQGVGRFYRIRRFLGEKRGRAVLSSAAELGPWLAGRRNVVEGFHLFHLPLLASYSRSGTNLIRYAVEHISGRPTPGQKRLHKGPNLVFDRAHKAYPVMERYPCAILVLRDYRECLLRQHAGLWHKCPDVVSFLENETVAQPPGWYIRNLEAFDRFSGEKLLLYYEDLLLKPGESILSLSRFLGLDPPRTGDFLRDIEKHYADATEAYTYSGHVSETSRNKNVRKHAQTWLDPEQRRAFDRYYRERYPELQARYLKRYEMAD
jgi:hypothetical protein